MSLTIVELFYQNGAYVSESGYASQSNYISLDHVTGTYVSQSLQMFNSLCDKTSSVSTASWSTGNIVDDLIIAELALSIADSEYDKLHVDPETGAIENKHEFVARKYMTNMYGVMVDGEMVLPREAGSNKPYYDLKISTAST